MALGHSFWVLPGCDQGLAGTKLNMNKAAFLGRFFQKTGVCLDERKHQNSDQQTKNQQS